MERIIVTGHRGAAGLEPENTLRSFRRACDLGVDRVETDVHLTRDGHLVCIHDATVGRTTDGSGPVREMTLAEIRRLDAGQGERVPTLHEAIETVRGRATLQIELKAEETPAAVIQVLEETGMTAEEVLISGFDMGLIQEVQHRKPDLPVSLLFGDPPSDALARARSLRAGSLAINLRFITREWVDEAHQAGLEIRAYNPDSREEMERVLALGVDGMGTNRPDLLLDLLRERGVR